jgi:hypothetical protein
MPRGSGWTGDICPQTLACLRVDLAFDCCCRQVLLDGAWLVVAACVFALGVVFALVGTWPRGRSGERLPAFRRARRPMRKLLLGMKSRADRTAAAWPHARR